MIDSPHSTLPMETLHRHHFDHVSADELAGFVEPLLQLIGELTGMETCYLTQVDSRQHIQHVLLALNSGELAVTPGLTLPWTDTLCQRAQAEGIEHCDDIAERWPDTAAARDLKIQSLVSLPVHLSDGRLWGTLCAASQHIWQPDPHALALMRATSRLVAQQIALIQRAHLAEQSLGRMAMVAEVSRVCLDADDLGRAVRFVAERLQGFHPWLRGLPFVLEGDQLAPDDQRSDDEEALIKAVVNAFGQRVLQRNDDINPTLLGAHEISPALAQARQRLGLSAQGPTALLTASTPLLLQAGVVLVSDDTALLEDRDHKMLVSCSNALSLLADRLYHHGSLEARNLALSQEVGRDPLTGLPNRRQLMARLEQTVNTLESQPDQQLLMAFIDLDGFKKINDQHGHEAGDLFLVSIANRLRQGLRSDDWVARLGGDEFIVLTQAGTTRPADDIGRHLAERIDTAIIGLHDLGSVRLDYGGASIGVVQWQGETPRELIRKADEAMYVAKRRRRGEAEP